MYLIQILKFSFSEKNVRNRPDGIDIYLVNVKTIRTIAQIFVVFSEKLNFKSCNSKRNPARLSLLFSNCNS